MRKYLRRIAKARMAAMGVGNVNRKMRLKKDPKDRDELPNWKKALYGKTGEEAHRIQLNLGKLKAAKKKGKPRRVIKKVS